MARHHKSGGATTDRHPLRSDKRGTGRRARQMGSGGAPPAGVWGRAPPAGVWGLAPIRRTRRDFVNARARDVADYIPLRTSHESRAPRPLPQPQPEPDPITRMFQRGTAGSPKHDPSTASYLPKARREGFWLRGFQGALLQVAPKFQASTQISQAPDPFTWTVGGLHQTPPTHTSQPLTG